ncbi:unnamed protein product [Rotaria magnacalcarata]
MESNSFVNLIQSTALKELPKFTGDPQQKVTQFIDGVERIGIFTELNESLLHSIATIKLGGAAFNWYDNNKETLRSWRELKQHLLERFKPSLSTAKTQLKERKQQAGETLIAYYDDVIDLCKQVDNNMPLHMIVDYLQDGLRHELKIHVKRQLKALNDEPTPAIFLKIARDEEELQHEISSEQQPSITPPQPYFARFTAATGTSLHTLDTPHHSLQSRSTHIVDRNVLSKKSRVNRSHQSVQRNQYYPCLICHRSNHRTIDCYSRKPNGCYKCGDDNHHVRNCPQVFP